MLKAFGKVMLWLLRIYAFIFTIMSFVDFLGMSKETGWEYAVLWFICLFYIQITSAFHK